MKKKDIYIYIIYYQLMKMRNSTFNCLMVGGRCFTHRIHQFCLFFVAHGYHSQHQIDQVERSEKYNNCEENDMNRSSCGNHLKSYLRG